jgi:enterochelin esterase-like enzyme
MTFRPLRHVVLGSLLFAAACSPPPDTTGAVSEEIFYSALVGDDYVLRIRLPVDYENNPSARYPLIVQLDPTFVGLQEFAITAGLVSQKSAQGLWPEAIVVGVDYPDPFQRERDYRVPKPPDPSFGGAGADRFYRVLRDEVLPYVDTRLRTEPGRRTLIGHSNGAVFAWYASFRHAPPEAPLFSAVLASDCGYDEELFTYERWHAERSTSLPLRFYTARAVFNGAIQQIGFFAMLDRVGSRGYQGLELFSEELETDHGGVIRPSFEHGLDFIFGVNP